MIKTLTAALALTALASLAIAAEPTKMSDTELDTVVAGTADDCKGNNGWGNGSDMTNAGSFSGATEPTKSTDGLLADSGSGLNLNPVAGSDGR